MILARNLVPAFPDDGAVIHDDAADDRIRHGRVQPFLRETQSLRHIRVIGTVGHGLAVLLAQQVG